MNEQEQIATQIGSSVWNIFLLTGAVVASVKIWNAIFDFIGWR